MDRLRELVEGEVVRVCERGRGDKLILESIEAGVGDEVRRLFFGKWVTRDQRRVYPVNSKRRAEKSVIIAIGTG